MSGYEPSSGAFRPLCQGRSTALMRPSSDDVLKARIQTQGVEEHILNMETGTSINTFRVVRCP
jgi:hypothetical protein